LKGKLVFVVIHQPSSDIFKMFDRLMILDVGGFPIYYGNPVDAVIYFKRLVNHVNSEESECLECGNVNPEQIFNIIETKVVDEYGNPTNNRKFSPSEWNEHYRELIESHVEKTEMHSDKPEVNISIPNKIKQFLVFTLRDVKSKLTNTQYLLISLLEAPVLAFVLAYLVRYFNVDVDTSKGYIFRENENAPAYMFMSVVVALFIGLTVSAEEIIRDRKILKRESFLNLSRFSYLFSKISIMFVLSGIQTLLFVLVGNSVLGIKGMWVDYWLVLFTTSCFANMLGLNISSSFNSAVTIYILIPFLIIPQLLLSGVLVKFDKLNPTLAMQGGVPIAGEVMTSRWAYEALAVNQFKSNAFEVQFYKYDRLIAEADYKKSYWAGKMTSKIVKAEHELGMPEKAEELKLDIRLLQNELIKESKLHKGRTKYKFIDKIEYGKIDLGILEDLKRFLNDGQDQNSLRSFYIKLDKDNRAKKNALIEKLTNTDEKQKAFSKLQEEYENDALNSLVKNDNDLGDKCLEKDGKLIQRTNPIFLYPDNNFGRAHFFAPYKRFFGRLYSTFGFNLCVIWLMSLIMVFTLYFDVLKRLLDRIGNFFDRFKKRSRA
jgi:hypothetical protein